MLLSIMLWAFNTQDKLRMISPFKCLRLLNPTSLNMTQFRHMDHPHPHYQFLLGYVTVKLTHTHVPDTDVCSEDAQTNKDTVSFLKEFSQVGERTETVAASNTYITLTMCQALF